MTYQASSLVTRKPLLNSRNVPNMGTSASSKISYKHSQISSLLGGQEMNSSNSRYQSSPRVSMERLKQKDKPKLRTYHQSETYSGPIRADHNIGSKSGVKSSNDCSLHSNSLSKRKSQSCIDLTQCTLDDKKIEKTHKFGFDFIQDSVQTFRNNQESFTKRSEQILSSAKQKLKQLNEGNALHRRYSSSNDLDAITNRLKTASLKHMEKDGSNISITDILVNKDNRQRRLSADITLDVKHMNSRKEYLSDTSPTVVSPSLGNKKFSSADTSVIYCSGLTGLQNIGNTCFMNSILQCLCKTKLLREYFLQENYKYDLNMHAPTKGKLAIVFAKVMSDMWTRENDCITPSSLKNEVQLYARRFVGSHQHDAQEFMRFFIEGVHDDLNQVKTKPTLSNLEDSDMGDKQKSIEYWQRYASREKSAIQDIFVGQLKSILTCATCKFRSVTFDPFWDLSLPIPRSRFSDVDIRQCFQAFTQEEVLDGDEKPTCEKCKKRRRCTKRFLIDRFPKILVIHLKRFSGERYRTKLDATVNFPFQLDLSTFAANDTANPEYSLYGVANHMGSTYGGHYTAYCKHPDTGKWHRYNDSRVHEIAPSKVVSPSAYVLFYESQ